MEAITWKLEVELGGVGAGWTDITNDVLPEAGLSGEDGMQSTSPTALLADPGSFNCTLDNAPSNSGGVFGYYSVNHAACRSGWKKDIRLRFSITRSAVQYFMNIYWLKEITPSAGLWGEATVTIKGSDWLDQAKELPLPPIGVQANQTGDQLITTLLAAITTQPAATLFDTGDSNFVSSFDKDDSQSDSVYSVISKICRSEYGRAYLQADTVTGGKLIFEKRNNRLGNVTSLGTISDAMDGVEIIDDASERYDQVKVTITPRTIDASNVRLARLGYHLPLDPGEEQTFTLYYVDPNGGSRISGKSIASPVTFKFGTIDDGSSDDLHAGLTVTIVRAGANSSDYKVKNDGAVHGIVNLFELYGLGIYPYNDYSVSAGTEGLRVLSFDMPYQTSGLVATSVCNYLQSIVSNKTRRGAIVTFHANKSSALMTAALAGGISSRWTIIETLTGMAGDWFINGRRWSIGLGGRLDMTWYVVPASGDAVWVLDTSALDVDTRLAV